MPLTENQDQRVLRYLLGDLPEHEQFALEQEYFADPEKFESVWAAENDLVDDYVRGRLAEEQRKLFEQNYLSSPPHRQRVAVARSLLDAAAREVAAQVREPAATSTLSWLERVLEWLHYPHNQQVVALTAVVLLLICGLLGMYYSNVLSQTRLRREITKLESERREQQQREQGLAGQLAAERERNERLQAELEQLAATSPQSPQINSPSIFSFFLSPLLTRGGEPQDLAPPSKTDFVRFQMKLVSTEVQRFQIVLRTVEGKTVRRQQPIKPARRDQTGVTVAVTIPAAQLPPGDYILTLSALNPSGAPEEINRYFFRVRRS